MPHQADQHVGRFGREDRVVDVAVALDDRHALRRPFAELGNESGIGVGINPPTPSWGQMVGENQQFLRSYWHLCVFPSIAIAVTMLSFTFFGDGVRDALDPRLK